MRIFLALVLVAGSGLAQVRPTPADDLDNTVKRGIALRRQGKDQEALAAFQQAAAIRRTERVVAQIALAEQALGLWVEAARDFDEALHSHADAWVEANRRNLEEARAVVNDHLGSLSVWGQPDGAVVSVNEKPVGKLPTVDWIRIPLGNARLGVRAEGYDDLTRQLDVQRGAHLREHVELVKVVSTPSLVTASAVPVAVLANDEPTRTRAAPGESAAPIYTRWWFWTAVGVVAAGVAVGAVALSRNGTPNGCDANATCATWGGSP